MIDSLGGHVPVEKLTTDEWLAEYATGIRTKYKMQKDNSYTKEQKHEQKRATNRAAVASLLEEPALLSDQQAEQVVRMIIAGKVPKVSIEY